MASKKEMQERELRRKKRRKEETRCTFLMFFAVLFVGAGALLVGWKVLEEETGEVIARVESESTVPEYSTDGEAAAGGNQTDEAAAGQADGGSRADGQADGTGSGAAIGKYDEILANPEQMAADRIYAKEAASSEEVTLAFAGDILFADGYAIMAKMQQRGQGIEGSISAGLLEEMRGADIFLVNNEFTYTLRGTPTEGKKFTFRAKPEYASYLLDMGADMVSLANNHAYDYGEISLLDTMDTLNGIGMPFAGAGKNLEEAMKPVYFIANDMKIAIVAATQIERLDNPDTKGATEQSAGVLRCWNPDNLLKAVAEAEANSDFVIVYIHWGTESVTETDWAQKDQAPKLVEAGADLIIGNHPHILQKIGYCGDVPVVYSLGNFLFNSKTQDSCLIKVGLDKNGLKWMQFLPALQSDCSVSLHQGAEKERALQFMRNISSGVTIDGEGFVTKTE